MLKDGECRVGDDEVFAAAFVYRPAVVVAVNTRRGENQRVVVILPCCICRRGGMGSSEGEYVLQGLVVGDWMSVSAIDVNKEKRPSVATSNFDQGLTLKKRGKKSPLTLMACCFPSPSRLNTSCRDKRFKN